MAGAEFSIPIRRGGKVIDHALVDAEDHPGLARWSWSLNTQGYAKRSEWLGDRYQTVTMARVVLGLPVGDVRVADHINRNRLDNRRSNLRIADHRVNARNRTREGLSSRFLGVAWNTKTRKWQVQVDHVYLGQFDDELDAAQAAIDHLRANR